MSGLTAAIKEHEFLLGNPVIWAILALAFLCYGVLLELCLGRRDDLWYHRTLYWADSLKPLLAALPLLGLLGTITGLLKTFVDMSVDAGVDLQELVSGGIGEAMFTTQLGLMAAVPGLLMLAYLHHRKNRWMVEALREVEHRA